MSFTEITPFDGLLPTSDDPASFDVRADALMSWLVANFAPEVTDLAGQIATALNGETDTLTALQSLSDSLGELAGMDVGSLTVTLATWISGVSGDPKLISPGQLLSAMVNYRNLYSVGYGHSMVNMAALNSPGVASQNTTGRAVFEVISVGTSSSVQISPDNATWSPLSNVGADPGESGISFPLPPGWYSKVTGSIRSWWRFQ